MPIDIDALIAKGLAMKQAGQSGRQVAEMLDREGVPPGARRFILDDIAKAELKAAVEQGNTGHRAMKGMLGMALFAGGIGMAVYLWSGIDGWNIISTVPLFLCAAGVWVLTSK